MSEPDSAERQREEDLYFQTEGNSFKRKSRSRRHRRKHKMSKKALNSFEQRYAELARENALIPEERRIDFVLVHGIPSSEDVEDKEEQEKLQKQELERAKFQKLLTKQGFTLQISEDDRKVFTKLFCPFKRLCREAEKVKLEMPIKDCQQMDSDPGSCLTRFIEDKFQTDNEEDFISAPFFMNKIDKFEGHENPNKFFRPAIRSLLTLHILINCNIDAVSDDLTLIKPDIENECADGSPQEKKGLSYMMMQKNYTDYFILHEESARSTQHDDNHLPTPTPTQPSGEEEEGLEGLDQDPRKDMDDTWTKLTKFQPLWKIRNYFGERIAFYFAWSGMLCTTLWFPMLFGLIVFFYGIADSVTSDDTISNATSLSESFQDLFGDFKQSFDNSATPYFGLFICVWGTIFLEIWKRKNAELAYEWDVGQFETNEPDRPNFSGTKSKKDPVTDEWVWYYPFKIQFLKFWVSFSVLIVMIVLVLISVLSVITYRIIITIDFCPNSSAVECLVVGTIMSSVLNAISILVLSRIYNVLARWLTDWENHQTQTRYDDALIFKLFAFQFANNYASCFYIAFFQGNSTLTGFLEDDKYRDSCDGSCMTKLSFQVLILMLLKPMPKFFKDIVWVSVNKYKKDRPLWRSLVRSGVSEFEEKRIRDKEQRRQKRKDRERSTSQPGSAPNIPCPHCNRHFRAKIGLISHLRTHPTPQWVKKMWRKHPSFCKCLRQCACCKSGNQVSDVTVEGGNIQELDTPHTQHMLFLKHEYRKPSLGDFTLDEYMEKVIQYGFLMLFGISLPLAPLLALLTNLFDLRMDARRLLWWYRRPVAKIAQDIGMWFNILVFVNFVGVISSGFILGFTSSWGDSYSTTGKLIIVLAFEHIVFALKYIISYLIPDTPAPVQLAIRREQYQILKKMEDPVEDVDYGQLFPGEGTGKGGRRSVKTAKGPRGMPSQAMEPSAKQGGSGGTHITYLNASGKKGTSDTTAGATSSRKNQEGKTPGSLVSASDVQPLARGGTSWEVVEATNSPDMDRHSPKYR